MNMPNPADRDLRAASTTTALPPVLYEDPQLVAFDKPSGMLVAPDRWDKSCLFLTDLLARSGFVDYRNVHRLDRETSGIVLCAKDAETLRVMSKRFETHEIEKHYVAIVRGTPRAREGAIDAPLMIDPRKPGRVVIS